MTTGAPGLCARAAYRQLFGFVALYKSQGVRTADLLTSFRRQVVSDLNTNYLIPAPSKQYFLTANEDLEWFQNSQTETIFQGSGLDLVLSGYSPKHNSLIPENETSTPGKSFLRQSKALVEAAYNLRCAQMVTKLEAKVEEVSGDGKLGVVSLPSWAQHPLVSGDRFPTFEISPVNFLEKEACGILVITVGHKDFVEETQRKRNWLRNKQLVHKFQVVGEFGYATDDFTSRGPIREKSTYSHVTKSAVDKVINAFLRGQKKLVAKQLRVHANSEELYNQIIAGEAKPEVTVADYYDALSCTVLHLPHIELHMSGLNCNGSSCRRFVHELGLELRTNAVTSKARLYQLGPFTLEHTLLLEQVNVQSVINSLKRNNLLVRSEYPSTRVDEISELSDHETDATENASSTTSIHSEIDKVSG